MYKRIAFIVILVIAVVGFFFIALDILDVDEGFTIHLPVGLLNTVFISAVTLVVAFIAARQFAATGSRQVLYLGCGSLALAAGTTLKAWLLGEGLPVLITIYESTLLLSSILHLAGVGMDLGVTNSPKSASKHRVSIVLIVYAGTLLGVSLITFLALQGVTAPLYLPENGSSLRRDIVRGIAAFIFGLSSTGCLIRNFRSHSEFLYWYGLGLALFALGVLFMSQGVENRVGWLGRVSMYAGAAYALVAVLFYRPNDNSKYKTDFMP